MSGVDLIVAERLRQVSEEGWTPEHDEQHSNSELLIAAVHYAMPDNLVSQATKYLPWPWELTWYKRKKHDRIKQLVIAGALIAAEIDRLQRVTKSELPTK